MTNTVGSAISFPRVPERENLVLMKIGEPCVFQDPRGESALVNFTQTFGIPRTAVSVNVFSGGRWSDPSQALAPGEGAVLYNPSSEFIITFIGIPVWGYLMNFIPAGISLKAGIVPQSGLISTVHLFGPSPGDTVHFLNDGASQIYAYSDQGTWSPAEPVITVGQSFLVRAGKPFTWSREFNAP